MAAGRLSAGQKRSGAGNLPAHILAGISESHFPVIYQKLDTIPGSPALPAPPSPTITLLRPHPETILALAKGTGSGVFAAFGSGDPLDIETVSLKQIKNVQCPLTLSVLEASGGILVTLHGMPPD